MLFFTRIEPLQVFLNEQRNKGLHIGLVPTMGALHRGHLSLVEASKRNGDVTVSSLFVNPTQFNDPGDLEKYPRDLQSDKAKLDAAGCDVLFAPDITEMYAQQSQIKFDFGKLDKILEGKFRPGHFSGVALVVSKLFNIVRPHAAYFGRKDFQQCKIISVLNDELNFGINIHCLPTVREGDGLAMSSRNLRLGPEERVSATSLYTNLSLARKQLLEGRSWADVQATVIGNFRSIKGVDLEYFELVDKNTLSIDDLKDLSNGILLVAAVVGPVRLIDNLPLA